MQVLILSADRNLLFYCPTSRTNFILKSRQLLNSKKMQWHTTYVDFETEMNI
jgi:hypothetical protein